ncbi:MAG: NAD(P)H-hydrate dehydratase [Mangrovibacterium sp.]
MKVFTSRQIAAIDRYTIDHEPVSHIDLMERAALQVVNWLIRHIPAGRKLLFFAGPGNNGGDALAVARMMANRDYCCEVILPDFGKAAEGSPAINLQRLQEQGKMPVIKPAQESQVPPIPSDAVVIDGLFGSGLTRQPDGLAAYLIRQINESGAMVVSIDIPSGLFGEDNSGNDLSKVVRASYTLSFQFPKLSFFFPEHEELLGQWEVLPIDLHPQAIADTETPYHFLTHGFIGGKLTKRKRFAHKGSYGHALLIAGSRCKMGAAVLSSRACLRAGVGLLTAHVPNPFLPVMHVAVPEAMCSADASDLMFTEFPELSPYSAVGVGPGIGTKPNCQKGLYKLLTQKPQKMVLDADALNVLSLHREWLELLPANAILTPHPKEFERLAGPSGDSWTRLQLQVQFSRRYQVIVILKGAYTSISLPDGQVFFNTSGNPGMATAGSGDVLTGIILGLLAQPYPPADAALAAVYLHGVAGDLAADQMSEEALNAGDLISFLGKAFIHLRARSGTTPDKIGGKY